LTNLRSLNRSMLDFLDTLAMDAAITVDSGYYQTTTALVQPKVSLKKAILQCTTNAVITEVKAASPSLGPIRTGFSAKEIAQTMERAGAIGISVLTEPKHFNGSLTNLAEVRQATKLPILMKDIIIVPEQMEVGTQLGANAVLLIQALFDKHYCEMSVDKMIAYAHTKGLEVLLETHTTEEFKKATETDADLIGVNNRNLATLKIDLNATKQILQKHPKAGKTVISESGIKTSDDLQFLRGCGADAFLIGSSIMLNENVELKVTEFVQA
jgi:indole-3-glycerol phosphate synthase